MKDHKVWCLANSWHGGKPCNCGAQSELAGTGQSKARTSEQAICSQCGRALKPCPARWDGEDTFVGYAPCICSRSAWLNSDGQPETYEEYVVRIGTANDPAQRPGEPPKTL